jgi:DNA invertase Pin-like site-specific DNA recombinase
MPFDRWRMTVQHERRPKSIDDSRGLRAAQYVRMSTDKQKYSIQNQKEAIAAYAARHDLAIVGTYEDAGRSGLRIDGRQGLASFCRETQFIL